jgi:uncharacterized protein YbgA (DUF1722 family)/uncharacterized protein YbbK (DUF523 family)
MKEVEIDEPTTTPEPIRVGVSACLLGSEVRFDGGHKRDLFIVELLGRHLTWVPVCPELEIGLGVPREALRLTGEAESPRIVGNRSGIDHTDAMQAFAGQKAAELAPLNLHGYIFKKNSPSCGLSRVRVYKDDGMPVKKGAGVYAARLRALIPMIPMEEEGPLHDPEIRENFVERVFAFARWRALLAGGVTAGRLVAFHTREKLAVMSHSTEGYRALGRLVAKADKLAADGVAMEYGAEWMRILGQRATRRKQVNVLQHVQGYFKRALDAADRAEISEVVERYRLGQVPLIVPITLLKHHLRRHPDPWLLKQTYFSPYPDELMLRNGM